MQRALETNAPKAGPSQLSIQRMFDELAPRYDLFNDWTSLGLAVFWRKKALEALTRGMHVLDLGCGTGELCLVAAKRVGPAGEVVGLDFSEAMLARARRKTAAAGEGSSRIRFVRGKAEEISPSQGLYDAVVSGFVLRNIYESIDAILDKVFLVLKPGGILRFVDITRPPNRAVRFFWRIYMATFAALFGRLLFGRRYPAAYLTESAERFPDARAFQAKLKQRRFTDVEARPFLMGIITLYSARKPSEAAR